MQTKLDELVQIWDKAFMDAADNYRNTGGETVGTQSVQQSEREAKSIDVDRKKRIY